MNQMLFLKFQSISILPLQVMYGYVHWYCSIDRYCVKLSLVDETLCKRKKMLSFQKEMISAQISEYAFN